MEQKKSFDIRVIIEVDDELYVLFEEAKRELESKSNTETARILIKKGCDWITKQKSFIGSD